MSVGLVKQLSFEKRVPIDGGSWQMKSVWVPATGAGTNTPNFSKRPDFLLDGANSFLPFQVMCNDTTNNLELDHSCDCFFQKLEVLHGGAVLETIDKYHQLSAMLLAAQVDS